VFSVFPVPGFNRYLRLVLVVPAFSELLLFSFTVLLLFWGEVAVLLLLFLLLFSLAAVLLLWVAVLLLTSVELELLLCASLRLVPVTAVLVLRLALVALELRLVTAALVLLLSADVRLSRVADAFLSGTVAVSLREVSLLADDTGLVSDELLV